MYGLEQESAARSASAVVFEPYTLEFDVDPYPLYRALRDRDPLHWWESSQAWVVSRYADVAAILRDRRFSVRYTDWELAPARAAAGPNASAFRELLDAGLFALDEKGHARVRKLVSPTFTPRSVERVRPDVQRLVDEALFGLAPGERVDVATRFAEAIPLRVIASILGVPRQDEAAFRRFGVCVAEAVATPWIGGDELEALTAPVPIGLSLIRGIIEDRRAHPGDDLLSALVAVEEEGDRLTTPELLSLVAALIIAGSETTVHAIAFGILNLLRHPDQLHLLLAEPALVRPAVDELLRYDLFGRIGSPRFALEDVALHGRTIRKGQMALLLVASALRDPAAFPDPDRLDLRRDTSSSIAFGIGAHYCLGASLARLEAEVALGTFFRRFPGASLDGEPTYGQHLTMRRLGELPVRLG